MTAAAASPPDSAIRSMDDRFNDACEQACAVIAPVWPLDRAIAVNPHWKRVGRPIREVAARLACLGGIRLFPSRIEVRQAFRSGRITLADLGAARAVLSDSDKGPSNSECLAALDEEPGWPRLPLLIDVLDNDEERERRLSWRQAITHQVSQTCASYFDVWQADWQPQHREGLYAFWRETLTHDHGIGVLMGLPDLRWALGALPEGGRDAERWVLERLGLPESVWADYLEAVLLSIHGWASWCEWLGWEADLAGRPDSHLRELLAIRMAWGVIVLECKDDVAAGEAFDALRARWADAPRLIEQTAERMRVDEIWQTAWEIVYQRELARGLLGDRVARSAASASEAGRSPSQGEIAESPGGAVRAFFCIDVRSEPLRRELEAVSPDVRTSGFAGFFGLPLRFSPLASSMRRPQLPGLLAPSIEVVDAILPVHRGDHYSGWVTAGRGAIHCGARLAGEDERDAVRARRRNFASASTWDATTRWPGASFSFVEAAGLAYVGKLFRWLRPSRADRVRDDQSGLPARYRSVCRPVLAEATLEQRVELAERVLRAAGLDNDFGPLVLWIGHGSQTANNAQAAALDCGACGGQTGEVNARVLALLLNEGDVREGLRVRGLNIPERTVFAALLHNTTTDEIEVFDRDTLPGHAQRRLDAVLEGFSAASDRVRRRRAPELGEEVAASPEALLERFKRRANDGAETRPEWGLAGNAAFLIAPRQRSQGIDLGGRCFLHDYDAAADEDGGLLELLMTAPMLVTHWINWQYHASTCDPQVLGSGNKLLHNVVGGHIGVFEGNGGDLRIGLARQSLRNGERSMHEPLRLTVIIDAPRERIERVIGAHRVVHDLIENGWLHLWHWNADRFDARRAGRWVPLPFDLHGEAD